MSDVNEVKEPATAGEECVISVGDVRIFLDRKAVERGGTRVHLTGREYGVLELLALRRGGVVTKNDFLDHLYAGEDEPDQKIFDVYVHKLRKKLGKETIMTKWGRGYHLPSAHYSGSGDSGSK